MKIDRLLEKDIFPDWLIRIQIRRLLALRLKSENCGSAERNLEKKMEYIRVLRESPIATHTDTANQQHYEVPSEFFLYVLGSRMKYSSGLWLSDSANLDESEEAMLKLYMERAEVKDGMAILDLGCGWGSLSLYVAERFPKCKVTGISNSKSQKEFIEKVARQRGLRNLEILTQDMNDFKISKKFDRILSIEMLEHMKNYELLLAKIAQVLKPSGKLFIHIFTHREYAYPYEVVDDTDWMAKYFFTGGQMPSDDLLLYFQKDFEIERHWIVNGRNYQKTSESWLANMYENKEKIIPILERVYGKSQSTKWWVYWRIFFMACAELFGYNDGNEWFVSHYLLKKRLS